MRCACSWMLIVGLSVAIVASGGHAQTDPPREEGGRPQVVALDGHVTIDVENADITTILCLLAEAKKLNIIAGPEISAKVSVSLHDVPFDDALTAVLGVAGYTHYKVGDIIYVTTEAKKKELPQSASDMIMESFRVNHVEPKEMMDAVTQFLSPAGKAILGPGKTIVVHDSPANVEVIKELVGRFDVPKAQVLIVAHIVSVDRKNNLEIGAGIDTPPYQLFGADVVTSGFAKIAPGMLSLAQAATAAATGAASAATTGASGTSASGTGGTSGGTSGGTTSTPSGLFVSTLQTDFRAFLDALEEKANVNILASPEILALDGQEARIQVGERLGFRVTTTTTTASLESVDFIEVGTVLEVTPNITDDGLIRMIIHPKISSGVVGPTGLPTESTTEVTTEMIVKNGETIVIGGLLDASKQRSRSQVPILGDIPLLGSLFGRNKWIDNKREVMIMISPMIVGTSPSPEMRARMETATARAQVEPKHALEKMTGLDNLPKKTAPPLPTRPFAEDDAKASSPDPVPAVVPPAAKAEDGASAMPGLRTPAPEPLVSAGVPPTAKAEECGPVMLPDPPLLLPEPPVSTLPPPTPKTEEAVLAPPEPAMPESPEPQAAKGYAIQVAAFIGPARQAKAEEYQRGLKAKSDWTTDLVASGDDECIRVLTGDYPDREMANKACRELKKRAGFAASFVRRRSQRSVTVTGSGEEPSLANVDASTATGSREKPSPVNVDASTAPEMQEAVVPADVQAETDTRETRQGLADGEEQPQKEATKLPGQVSGKRNFARTNKRVDETN